jgi:hypothetical protein
VTIETAFSSMMPSSVTITSVSATDAYGKRTFSGATTVQCRIQKSKRLINSADGKQIPEEGRVYCYGTASATVNDRLTLPDGSIVPILSVETRNDESGTYVTVISFGKAS